MSALGQQSRQFACNLELPSKCPLSAKSGHATYSITAIGELF